MRMLLFSISGTSPLGEGGGVALRATWTCSLHPVLNTPSTYQTAYQHLTKLILHPVLNNSTSRFEQFYIPFWTALHPVLNTVHPILNTSIFLHFCNTLTHFLILPPIMFTLIIHTTHFVQPLPPSLNTVPPILNTLTTHFEHVLTP